MYLYRYKDDMLGIHPCSLPPPPSGSNILIKSLGNLRNNQLSSLHLHNTRVSLQYIAAGKITCWWLIVQVTAL